MVKNMVKFEMTKVKCEMCNKNEFESLAVTTTDEHYLCIPCLREAQDYYKKGLLSLDEVKEFYEIKRDYINKTQEISILIRKYALHLDKKPVDILKEVMKLEKQLSESTFKKGQGFPGVSHVNQVSQINGKMTTNMDEHLAIINQVLENFDLIEKPIAEEILKEIKVGNHSNGHYENFFKNSYVLI